MKSTNKTLRPHTCVDHRAIRTCVVIGLTCLVLTDVGRAQFQFVAWGDNSYGQCNAPALPSGLAYVKLAAGGWHNLALRSDGSVVGWGYNGFGQCGVPALPSGLTYVDVAAGGLNTMARRNDGSVACWGNNAYGQCNLPPIPVALTYVKIDLGGYHGVALRSDGSAVAWGYNGFGQCNLPALSGGLTYVDVAAGGLNTMLRRSDGTIMWLGDNTYGQCNAPPLPVGLTYVMIDPGGFHTVALRSDGILVPWGDNTYGQCNVPPTPAGFTCLELAAGGFHTIARYSVAAIPASAAIRNGLNINPVDYTASNLPVIGTTWNCSIATNPNTITTFVTFAPGGPNPGFPFLNGEVLVQLSPMPILIEGPGNFAFAIPNLASLIGLQAATQGVRVEAVGPTQYIILLNALDLVLGV